jgi:hypothetical protein
VHGCSILLPLIPAPRAHSTPSLLNSLASRGVVVHSCPAPVSGQSCLISAFLLNSHVQPFHHENHCRNPATYTHFAIFLLLWCRKVLTVNESDRCPKGYFTILPANKVSATMSTSMMPVYRPLSPSLRLSGKQAPAQAWAPGEDGWQSQDVSHQIQASIGYALDKGATRSGGKYFFESACLQLLRYFHPATRYPSLLYRR